jgi:uncharacterized membrane protein
MTDSFKKLFRFFKARPRTDWIWVVVALAIFGGLTLWNITGASIWFDEAFSSYIIQYNFLDIARYTATDVHPPFFYWVLKVWSALFGTNELALRSMSVFFGAVTIVFAYLFAKRQFGRRAALMGLGLLVLSPLFIRYSQEARMYTLVTALVMSATYVMVIALEQKKRKLWVLYGVLVSLGMWTHYFTALAWIAHWVWRFITVRQTGARGKVLAKKFFDKNWLTAYIVAIGLYLPWLPAMAIQLVVIQSGGFWIQPVGVDTVTGYFGTLVYYLEHDHVTGWLAAGLVAVGILLAVLMTRVYRAGGKPFRRQYALLICLAAVPPIVLFIVSLPPLTSSFVERYLMATAVVSALFVGVTLAYGLKQTKVWKQVVVYGVIVAMLISGISSVYFYGNYNKNSRTDLQTKEVVRQAVEKSTPGEPIITNTPWVFYEAVFYSTDEHPVYFIDAQTSYEYGSLDMLKYSDAHKIKDLDAFVKEHPVVWYIGYAVGELQPPVKTWKKIDQVSATSHVDGNTVYKGVEFETR